MQGFWKYSHGKLDIFLWGMLVGYLDITEFWGHYFKYCGWILNAWW